MELAIVGVALVAAVGKSIVAQVKLAAPAIGSIGIGAVGDEPAEYPNVADIERQLDGPGRID